MPSKKGKSKSNAKANAAANSNSTQRAPNLPNGAPTVPDEAAPQAPPADETIEPKPLQEGEEQTQEQNHEHKDEEPSGPSRGEEQEEQDDVPVDERIRILEDDLEAMRQEKEALGNQYRSLLGKLTAMRTTLGDKLKEDAVGVSSLSFAHMQKLMRASVEYRRSLIDERRRSTISLLRIASFTKLSTHSNPSCHPFPRNLHTFLLSWLNFALRATLLHQTCSLSHVK